MEELELALVAVTSMVDELMNNLVKTPKKSNEYNYLVGKLEAYTDIQNMMIFRLNELRKGK